MDIFVYGETYNLSPGFPSVDVNYFHRFVIDFLFHVAITGIVYQLFDLQVPAELVNFLTPSILRYY